MELLVDDSVLSTACKFLASYSRSSIKVLEMRAITSHLLNLRLPVLSAGKLIKSPTHLLKTIVQERAPILFGKSPLEEIQIGSWIESANGLSPIEFLRCLNSELACRTFLVSNHVTVADIMAVAAVRPVLFGMSAAERQRFSCVLRWNKHLQTLPGLSEILQPQIPVEPSVQFNRKEKRLEKIVYEARKEEAVQVREEKKEEVKGQAQGKGKTQAKAQGKAQVQGKAQAQAKGKQPPKQQAQGGKKGAAATEVQDPAQLLDLRVGLIEEVQIHPSADKLYLEKVNLGTETRQVVSGLVDHISIPDFQGKLVVLLCNLKRAKLRGQLSEAMVLCSKDESGIKLLVPPEGSVPGDIVTMEGLQHSPVPTLNPKQKIWETVQPRLRVEDDLALYQERALRSEKGMVTCPGVKLGSIS